LGATLLTGRNAKLFNFCRVAKMLLFFG